MFNNLITNISSGIIQQGSLLNYLYVAYKKRVLADSGEIENQVNTNSVFNLLPQKGNIQFAWIGTAGSKKRTSTIWSYYSKIYNMFGANDAVQATDATQPYVGGNIAPNENRSMKNILGDNRLIAHSDISFATNQPWTCTICYKVNNHGYTLFGKTGTGKSAFSDLANGYFIVNSTGQSGYIGGVSGNNFKNKVITITGDGAGNVKIYIDGIYYTFKAIATGFDFNSLFHARTSYGVPATISAYVIWNKVISDADITKTYGIISQYYPAVPYVQIGEKKWSISNFEDIATAVGTAIPEVQLQASWAALTTPAWCKHNNDNPTLAIYGRIYNGYAKNLLKADINTSGNWGWHIPTEIEWNTLLENEEVTLKKEGTDFWNTTGGTNSTGLTVIGGAGRLADGTFGTLKNYVSFWVGDSDKVVKIYHDNTPSEIVSADLKEGAYIRLVKDYDPLMELSINGAVIDAVVGEESIIHGNELPYYEIGSELDASYVGSVGVKSGNNFVINAVTAGTSELTGIINGKKLKVTINAKEKVTGITNKILMIGDSITSWGMETFVLQIEALLSDSTFTYIGTKGTTHLHEGIPGWKWSQFVGDTSPFVKGGVLNVSSYFTDNSLDDPDIVFMNLGVNDTLSHCDITGNGLTGSEINTMIANAKLLIDAFLAYSASLKIIVVLPTICGDIDTYWNVDYDESVYSQNLFIFNMHKYWNKFKEVFAEGAYNARVRVSYAALSLDRANYTTSGVHPDYANGLVQLGKGLAIAINNANV